MTNLINNGDSWVVTYLENKEVMFKRFTTVDLACDFLVDALNVADDEVDLAIIGMSTSKHRRGCFDEYNKFHHSEID